MLPGLWSGCGGSVPPPRFCGGFFGTLLESSRAPEAAFPSTYLLRPVVFFCHFSGKPWGICGCCVLSPTPNDFKWHWVLGQKGSSDIRILNPSPRLPGNYHRPNNGHLKPALTNGTQILFNLDDKSLSLQKDKIIAAQMHKQNIWPRASALTKQKCHEARPL